ncbi:uncharacterized protein LOC112556982 [Pomacea canaliculata]|nr:uncharacterized protein LOC112556982 [Pomacea canaliculata]
MVPMGKSRNVLMEIQSISSSHVDLEQTGLPANVTTALEKEVKTFERREQLISDLQVLLYIHWIAACLALLTTRWYAGVWLAVLSLLAIWLVPSYTRLGGFVGNTSHIRRPFCIVASVSAALCLAVALYFAAYEWLGFLSNKCTDWKFSGLACSYHSVYTAVFFTLHSVILVLTAVLSLILLFNFQVELGDLIEKFLVQERDIEQVMAAAKNGSIKEKRTAAYDLAAMAASSDDNKFRIVAESGLNILVQLSLSRDSITQEHAVEALAELLTIPSIQETFVESGGINTLTAVLHSHSPRAMQEAASALYNMVAESESSRMALVADHGLDDLANAAHEGTIRCQRTVASIMLELAFSTEIRSLMASTTTPAQTLVHLCNSNDSETLRFSLQALEVLAIENPDLICAQDDLLKHLVDLPFRFLDERLYLLASKILLYFAENPKTCRKLLYEEHVTDSFSAMVKTHSAVLQKVVVKIMYYLVSSPELRQKASQKVDKVLEYVCDYPGDQDAWDMADECLQLLSSSGDLGNLPALSTLEKLHKMGDKGSNFGSRTSLGSEGKSAGSSASSSLINTK